MSQSIRAVAAGMMGLLIGVAYAATTSGPDSAPATGTAPATAPATASVPADPLERELAGMLQDNGIVQTSLKRDRDLCILGFTTNTARLLRLMGKLEATTAPIRVAGVNIVTAKPGVDNLNVVLQLIFDADSKDGVKASGMMRDLTALFPMEGNSIWVTSIRIDPGRTQWTVKGEYSNVQFAMDLYTTMIRSPAFAEPKLGRDPPGTAKNPAGFTVLFTYRGPPPEE